MPGGFGRIAIQLLTRQSLGQTHVLYQDIVSALAGDHAKVEHRVEKGPGRAQQTELIGDKLARRGFVAMAVTTC